MSEATLRPAIEPAAGGEGNLIKVAPGDVVRLKDAESIADWARGGTFRVGEVKLWGVIGWQVKEPGEWRPVSAFWHQIAGIEEQPCP